MFTKYPIISAKVHAQMFRNIVTEGVSNEQTQQIVSQTVLETLDTFEDSVMFNIWSMEHGAWWRPNHCGYTTSKQEAGAYSYYEACKIVEGANKHKGNIPNEAMILITA